MSNMDKKLIELKQLIEASEISLQQARDIISKLTGDESVVIADKAKKIGSTSSSEEGQIIEGLFDGQNMIGPDGKKYSVPANYASKSKLVEGDTLKLTITPDGSFVYKQINLLDRDRLVGTLNLDEKTDEYRVVADGKSYQVLTASITYYKGEPGDQVTILVPKGKESAWAAVENVYKPGDEIPSIEKPEEPKESTSQVSDLDQAPNIKTEEPASSFLENNDAKDDLEPIGQEQTDNLNTTNPEPSPNLSPLGSDEPSPNPTPEPELKPSPPSPAQPEDIFTEKQEENPLSQPDSKAPSSNDSFLNDDLDLDNKNASGLEEI